MSRIIVSPVKRFPGNVTLSDPLTYPQVFAWRDSVEKAQSLENVFEINAAMVGGILAIVEKWELANIPQPLTADNFPATPARSAAELVSWLSTEISALFAEAEEIPLG